ncbi:S-type Pyocin domain-containing protein, partial [Brenneria roseae subsp. roseae]
KYHADHMPSAAAVKAYLRRLYPKLDKKVLDKMAEDVAAIIIPAEIHQKISETYGKRNRPQNIEQDFHDLRGAVDRNFDAIKPSLKEHGATEDQLEAAREKMHKLNEEQGLY